MVLRYVLLETQPGHTWMMLGIVTDFYLITEAKSHYGDEKAKESFKFPQPYEEIETVSTPGHVAP